MIKIVLIDIDNTLLDFNKCASFSMRKAFEDVGLKIPYNLEAEFHKVNNELWLGIEKGTVTKDELHKNRWNMILRNIGVEYDGEILENIFRKYLDGSHETVDGAVEIVRYLSLKYRIYAASNAFYSQQTNRLKMAGMSEYIKGIFVSEKIGFEKPSKEYFDKCFELLKNPPRDEVIIIGDSLGADIIGGANYGIKTCWFNPNGDKEPQNCKIDYNVKSLKEIEKYL